ncbi:Seipin-like protein [Colletotrichum orbiculare MAFF 240422]|uniref:Seipin-like protein n=1 Tax=Colletotrichum orbiculare (strain 104-T / ATCC 96160 / CBS 514.97 / LARS 414 / MAFF 240422) TaxID=1213857 RepID=A0A484G5A8_COLOR|nr:Seipin-like protein [Colletotrichum orbiculare MAFF 240422]
METLGKVSEAATSKTAQRTLVNLSLLTLTSFLLLIPALLASTLFFQNYLPDQVLTTPVHLQYGTGANPFGTAILPSSGLRTQQQYDISVTLSLPRSPANTQRGNFMVALYLLDAGASSEYDAQALPHAAQESYPHAVDRHVLFSSRRPVLVPYQDPLVSLASRLFFLAYHMLFPDSQTCLLTVSMAEHIELGKGTSLPATALLEIQSGQSIETYHTTITLRARLRGLRWFMYHYGILAKTAATLLFWTSECLFMAAAWVVWSLLMGSRSNAGIKAGLSKDVEAIRKEDGSGLDELSDAPRTFPSYGKQAPLRFEPDVKEEASPISRMDDLTPLGGEADDEEEDEGRGGFRGDSGIGTSFSEGGSGIVRRRSSHGR